MRALIGSAWLLSASCWAQAHTDAAAQAHDRVWAQLMQSLPEPVRSQAQIQINISAARGAALHPCPEPWQWQALELAQLQRIHIGLSCAGAAGSLVARAQLQVPVWTARKALPAQHILQSNDLRVQQRTVRRLDDVLPQEQLLHMQLRRSVDAGQVLQLQHLQRALYAKKGQRIEIQAQAGAVAVSAPGIALRNGYQGERIRVRNLNSQTWVEGVLVGPGILQAESTQPGSGVTVQSSD